MNGGAEERRLRGRRLALTAAAALLALGACGRKPFQLEPPPPDPPSQPPPADPGTAGRTQG